jgi:tRNA U34 5-methylaminomethyl-2-thiouridine-forming methyltransferase MnmC
VEAYPVSADEATSLNYGTLFTQHPEAQDLLALIHQLPWNEPTMLREGFTVLKLHSKLKNVFSPVIPLINQSADNPFTLIYFDAFAPEVQPSLWTEEVFQSLYHQMAVGGILVTYCAKGSVRRALKAAGFTIEKLAGPPGKREMTRAVKVG